jgi:hypothetical protein
MINRGDHPIDEGNKRTLRLIPEGDMPLKREVGAIDL